MTASNSNRCPHCGQPIPPMASTGHYADQPEEPGIIHGAATPTPGQTFYLIQVQDLDRLSAQQRKALIYLRFKNGLKFKDGTGAFDSADGYIYEDWKKYLPTLQEGQGEAGQDELERDLAAVSPFLNNIIKGARFVYGYQSRIAEALNVPNQGSYRRRIKNVATAIALQLRDSTSTTTPANPKKGDAEQKAA